MRQSACTHRSGVNAQAWRGHRDKGLALEDVGDREPAQRLAAIAAGYQKTVLANIDRSTVRSVNPPFVPIALDGEVCELESPLRCRSRPASLLVLAPAPQPAPPE